MLGHAYTCLDHMLHHILFQKRCDVDIVYIEHRLLDYNQCMYTAQEVDIEELSRIFLRLYKEAHLTYAFIYSEMYCLHTV